MTEWDWSNWGWSQPVVGWQSQTAGPDPLADVEYSGSIEHDAMAEASELLKAFNERTSKEKERFELVTDSEYWFCVCFESRAQKDEFLARLGWVDIGDKYLDGIEVARRMGISLPRVQFPKTTKQV